MERWARVTEGEWWRVLGTLVLVGCRKCAINCIKVNTIVTMLQELQFLKRGLGEKAKGHYQHHNLPRVDSDHS